MGDLYRQGREIARFVPFEPDGFAPNAPFVWGPQPYKGHVFFTDYNSGLWAVRPRGEDRSGPGRRRAAIADTGAAPHRSRGAWS